MPNYDYLNIALRADIDSVTRTILTYPPSEPRPWERRLVSAGAAMKRFLNATECYILQQWEQGHCFSFITRHILRPEEGYCMISLFVKSGCALTGRQIIAIFSGLRRVLVEEENDDPAAITRVLEQAGVPEQPLHLLSWDYRPATEGIEMQDAAYRTYISQSELAEIFGFPSQPEYEKYRCIIVVAASASLRPGKVMPRITTPVRKLYTILAPEGVTVSAQSAFDGDRVNVTFTREGFDPVDETFTVGTPAAFTRLEGSTIRIREPHECGIRFVRRLDLEVCSSKGGDINGYTIAINGRPVNTMEPYVEFTEKDLTSAPTVEIKAASNNYAPLKINKPVEEILQATRLELKLNPIEQGVVLRLDFGQGRVIEQSISIEKNTPEYNRLHAGQFHGFRANRVINQDPADDTVIYNVDLRPVARQVQPEPERITPAPEAPVFENVSDEVAETPLVPEPEIDTTVPTVDSPAEEIALAEDDFTHRRKLRYTLLAVAGAIVALVVVLCFLIPSGKEVGGNLDDNPSVATDSVPVGTDNATTPAAPAPALSLGSDLEYLNTNAVWVVDSVTSPAGVALMNAFADGDIDAIANNEYFATGACKNSRATKALNLMWRAKTGPTRGSTTSALRKAAKSGNIDLQALYDRLARVQPKAEEANTQPLPSR